MPSPFRDPVVGDPLPTSRALWTAIVGAARDHAQPPGAANGRGGLGRTGYVEAWAFNDTGGDLEAFKPAKVTATADIDLTDDEYVYDWSRRPVLTLGTPSAATDIVAVTLEAIPDGQFGRVAVAGWCACDVDVGSSGDRYASPTTDTDALVSGSTGSIRILNTGTGTARRCAVYLGDQAGGAGGSTISHTFDVAGASTTLTGNGTYSDVTTSGVTLTAGTWFVSYTMTGNLNANTAGDRLIARLYPGSGFGYALSRFCTAQVTGVSVYEVAAGWRIITTPSGLNVKLQAAREYTGAAPATSQIIGTVGNDWATGLWAFKV